MNMIQGGTHTGAGVRFMDGKDNELINRGTIQTTDLLLGTAITATGGNETISNAGAVNGNVDLGAGINTFVHQTGALLQSGAFVKLGAGNDFKNQGTISTGGINTLQSTTLTGDFIQTGDANWIFDIKPDFTSDRFDISGIADLGIFRNKVNLNELGVPASVGRYTLITSTSGLTGSFEFGTLIGGTMPIGLTYTLINSDTQEQLDLAVSTGDFYWRGGAGNVWNGAFVDGESNWSRDAAGLDFIFGTPGSNVDVFFSSTAAENRATILGADFAINSLTVTDANETSINGDNTLTITSGITLKSGAGKMSITSDIDLAGNQTWLNNSANPFIIDGDSVGGSGFNLTVDGSGMSLINSVIETGSGSLTKTGSGSLTLYRANTYAGGTILNNGLLETANDHALGNGNVAVNQGVLRTINGLTAPTNTPVHLAIGGNYSQETPTELQLRIIGPSGVNDQLVVNGTAELGGTFRPDYSATNYNPIPPAGDYTDEFNILHANGGVAGKFDNFIDVHFNPDFLLRWEPVYEQNDVFLLWNQHPFTEINGLTRNQFAVGDVLNRALGIIPAIPMAYNDSTGPALLKHPTLRPAINYLNTRPLADLPVDYDLIAPEELTSIFTSSQAFTQLEATTIGNRLHEIREGAGSGFSDRGLSVQKKPVSFNSLMPSATSSSKDAKGDIFTPSATNPWGVFIAGSAESLDIDNQHNAAGFDIDTGGITVGVDYQVTRNFAVGLFNQYTNSDVDLVNDGSVDIEGTKLGLYATLYNQQGFYLNGLVAAGANDYGTRRLGLGGYAKGNSNGWDLDAMLGGGYTKHSGAFTFGPSAALIFSRQEIDRYTEHGSMVPLIIGNQFEASLVSRVGIDASYEWKIGETRVIPSVSLAWQHEFLDERQELYSRLAGAPQNGFSVDGPEIGRDSLNLRAGLEVEWNEELSTYVSYQTEIGRTGYDVNSLTLGLSFKF